MLPSSGLSTPSLRKVATRLIPDTNFDKKTRLEILKLLESRGVAPRRFREARLTVFLWNER